MDNGTTIASLNSLILLRHLELYGLEAASLAIISDTLKNVRRRYEPANYDNSNISPDSVRELFDEILSEEIALDLSSGVNGIGQSDFESRSIPRKRKASSSDYLAQYGNLQSSHHLPKLISRYYAKYRKDLVNGIKEDEDQLLELQREINSIERSCWDSKIKHRDKSKESDINADHALPRSEIKGTQNRAEDSSCQPISKQDEKLLEQLEELQDASFIPEENNTTVSTKAFGSGRITYAPDYPNEIVHDDLEVGSTNERINVGSHMKNSKNLDHLREVRGPETVPGLYKSSHALANSPSQRDSSKTQHTSLGKNPTYIDNRTSETNLNVLPHTKLSGTRNSPLLDKSVIKRTSPASAAETKSAEGPAQSPPDNESKSREQNQPENTGDFPQKYSRRSSDRQNVDRIPHESRAFPILSGTRQELSKAAKASSSPREALHDHILHNVQIKDTLSTTADQDVKLPSTPSRMDVMAKPPVAQSSKISPASSSIDSSNSIERPIQQLHEPSSVTKWRNVEQSSPASTQPLPRPRSVSPISDHEKAPLSLEPVEKRKGRRPQTLSRGSLKGQESRSEELDMYQTRSGLRRGARLRPSSAATSANSHPPKADKRTPSVTSHPDMISLEDSFPSGKEVKAEPNTPLATESSSSQQRFTPELPRTRSRRNAPQPLKLAPASTGRKRRNLREASVPDSTVSSASMPNRAYVAASKSFQRTSAPLMNEIMTHKHASLFSAPVKEKNAEGYRDVIFQPQDLKSIRLAISAGARAVAVAAAANATGNADSTSASGSPMAPSGSGGGSSTLLLPLSPDLVPPRGIVNSAQLEQELMRMFANAVMFNPGDDGVVKDTREMFEAVAAAVDSWKQAERAAENRGRQADDDEEVIGTPDEEVRGKRKR